MIPLWMKVVEGLVVGTVIVGAVAECYVGITEERPFTRLDALRYFGIIAALGFILYGDLMQF